MRKVLVCLTAAVIAYVLMLINSWIAVLAATIGAGILLKQKTDTMAGSHARNRLICCRLDPVLGGMSDLAHPGRCAADCDAAQGAHNRPHFGTRVATRHGNAPLGAPPPLVERRYVMEMDEVTIKARESVGFNIIHEEDLADREWEWEWRGGAGRSSSCCGCGSMVYRDRSRR